MSGYYGFGNLGDEALLDVIVTQLRARFPGLDIDVLSTIPAGTRRGCTWMRRRARNSRAMRARDRPRRRGALGRRRPAAERHEPASSLLYYAGDPAHGDAREEEDDDLRAVDRSARLLGPLRRARVLRRHRPATVRDERSRELLPSALERRWSARPTPFFLYEPGHESVDLAAEGLAGDPPYVIVCVRKVSNYEATVNRRAVDRLADGTASRRVLAAGRSERRRRLDHVIRRARRAGAVARMSAAARGGDHSGRASSYRHAAACAHHGGALRVPFPAIPYDPKVSALLDDLRYPLPPLWVPGRPRLAEASADALVDRLVVERDELAAHLAQRVEGVRAAAARNFDVLGELPGE